jgi:hypothetical protein
VQGGGGTLVHCFHAVYLCANEFGSHFTKGVPQTFDSNQTDSEGRAGPGKAGWFAKARARCVGDEHPCSPGERWR